MDVYNTTLQSSSFMKKAKETSRITNKTDEKSKMNNTVLGKRIYSLSPKSSRKTEMEENLSNMQPIASAINIIEAPIKNSLLTRVDHTQSEALQGIMRSQPKNTRKRLGGQRRKQIDQEDVPSVSTDAIRNHLHTTDIGPKKSTFSVCQPDPMLSTLSQFGRVIASADTDVIKKNRQDDKHYLLLKENEIKTKT